MGVLAYLLLVLDQALAGALGGTLFLAGAWAFLHSSLQKWAIDVTPESRATVVSLFASALFLGSAAGTAFGVEYVASGSTAPHFGVGLAVMVTLAVAVLVARHRYGD
ncbi:hypothetical protein [Georgenia sp. SYP-B2076]|uniref:hypothetical protein n=1 Tax=Georgenia sp. SYP-B2076 TaxID=2495881 RepID=UPI000F8EEF30|nr:hypothetical protein [Georgenia sp. SYP-B2076]